MTGGIGGVGAVGGISMGISSAAMGPALSLPAGMGSLGGLHGPMGDLAGSPLMNPALGGIGAQRLQQLQGLIEGFSSAEILLALMLAAAACKNKKEEDSGSSALALLAGMALASRLSQGLAGGPLGSMNGQFWGEVPAVGASLNLQA